jgi:hypothetical protein
MMLLPLLQAPERFKTTNPGLSSYDQTLGETIFRRKNKEREVMTSVDRL